MINYKNNNMINKIETKVKYEVVDNTFGFSYIFDKKEEAEYAEKYLDALNNFLEFIEYQKDKNKSISISVKPDKTLYFEGVKWSHYIEPDWMGHHPNGGYEHGMYPRSTFYNQFKKRMLIAKIYTSMEAPRDECKWQEVMDVYDDFKIIFPEDKACEIIKNIKFLSIAGVNIMNF